nr:hypothetical protein [Acinetobacter sp. Marseille-Q1620]
MQKIILTNVLWALLAVTTVSQASSKAKSNKISVAYSCQQQKKVKVNYTFDSLGNPVNALVNIAGKNHLISFNQKLSDKTRTYFGGEKSYSLAGDNISKSKIEKSSIMITAPTDEILFKLCEVTS